MARKTSRKGRLTKERREELMEIARVFFMQDQFTQKEIAEKVGVTERTISNWIEDGQWHKLKRNLLLTREEQLHNLYRELEEINNEIKGRKPGERYADKNLANTRRYLLKDIESLESETSASEFINAFAPFINQVKKQDIDDARLIGRYADEFIKTKLR